jgi:hypothetical protein
VEAYTVTAPDTASPRPLAKADYTAALRRYLGPEGRFRIKRDGTIHAKVGVWIVFGRIGDARTCQTLFGDGPRPKGDGDIGDGGP